MDDYCSGNKKVRGLQLPSCFVAQNGASIQSLQDSVTLKNNQALEQVLKYAMDKAVEAFLKMSRDSSPRTLNVLHKTLDNARQEAFEVFEAESDIAAQETMFLPYKSMLQSQLDNHVISIGQENENLIRQQATAKVRELVLEFKDNTVKIGLPLNETDLETRLVAEKERIHTSYTSSQAGFEEFESIKTVFKSLEEAVEEVCKERRHDNMVAYSKEVEVPLSTSKKIVLISADNYDTEFSLKQYEGVVSTYISQFGDHERIDIKMKYSLLLLLVFGFVAFTFAVPANEEENEEESDQNAIEEDPEDRDTRAKLLLIYDREVRRACLLESCDNTTTIMT
ncbi:hypothetical protein AC249_AIPGENE12367 [Exaiptasia diaphana]|nr:hypothetical protein AC249_AIPGENE12367 [Exaiptasia diaphana]